MLDEERLKDLHGNRTRVSGRHMHKEETQEFEWITKLILAANEGKIPHFSVQDRALTERIATVPHRSRFQADGGPTEEEFTFRADVGIKDKFPSWYPYMLRWCVQGLHRYHQVGFTNMPPGCLAFKQEILEEKDVVKEWLNATVQEGGSDDFVKVCDLYAGFCAANRSFQADKKTKKTTKMFERELHRCLKTDAFKTKHHYKLQERQCMAGKVFVGYRLSDTLVM